MVLYAKPKASAASPGPSLVAAAMLHCINKRLATLLSHAGGGGQHIVMGAGVVSLRRSLAVVAAAAPFITAPAPTASAGDTVSAAGKQLGMLSAADILEAQRKTGQLDPAIAPLWREAAATDLKSMSPICSNYVAIYYN